MTTRNPLIGVEVNQGLVDLLDEQIGEITDRIRLLNHSIHEKKLLNHSIHEKKMLRDATMLLLQVEVGPIPFHEKTDAEIVAEIKERVRGRRRGRGVLV